MVERNRKIESHLPSLTPEVGLDSSGVVREGAVPRHIGDDPQVFVGGLSALLLRAVPEQALQLVHEFLHVLEVQVDRGEPDVSDFIELLQMIHEQAANFGSGAFAVRGFADECLRFVDNCFKLADGHRAFFAGLQQSLEDFLALEFLAASVFLDHHVRNFVNTLVGGEPAIALQAFAAATNQVAGARLARVDHFVVQVRAERALHFEVSCVSASSSPPCSASASSSASPATSSARAIRFSSPTDQPSRSSSGRPTTQHPANVISQITTVATAAGSLSTPKISVNTRKLASCEPPPTPGSCAAEPTIVNARTRAAPAKLRPTSWPPKA